MSEVFFLFYLSQDGWVSKAPPPPPKKNLVEICKEVTKEEGV